MITIQKAESDEQILSTFEVMHQLRGHYEKEKYLVDVKRFMSAYNWSLAYISDKEKITGTTGYRITESLAWGKFLYVDDLSVADDERSKGYGNKLIEWLIMEAKKNNCNQIHLDSGVQRFDAHRFYLREKFRISCHHFDIILK